MMKHLHLSDLINALLVVYYVSAFAVMIDASKVTLMMAVLWVIAGVLLILCGVALEETE